MCMCVAYTFVLELHKFFPPPHPQLQLEKKQKQTTTLITIKSKTQQLPISCSVLHFGGYNGISLPNTTPCINNGISLPNTMPCINNGISLPNTTPCINNVGRVAKCCYSVNCLLIITRKLTNNLFTNNNKKVNKQSCVTSFYNFLWYMKQNLQLPVSIISTCYYRNEGEAENIVHDHISNVFP